MSWTKTRSDLALALKRDPNADVTELRRQLKAERLAEHVARVVDSAPPLSDEQRARIASMLAPAADIGGDAA